MARRIAHDDPRLSWPGAVYVERGDGWSQPWRLPREELEFVDPGLRERAAHGAGVRLAFYADTTTIGGEIGSIGVDPEPYGRKPIDLCVDGSFVGSTEVQESNRFQFAELKPGMKLIELWLPQLWRFRLRSLRIDDGAVIEPFVEPDMSWVVYGSSIEHCAEAASPTRTWPALVARGADLDLRCLGVGAQCFLDAAVARTIRDLRCSVITLCLGINVQIASTHNTRTFRTSVVEFVRLIRETERAAPIALVSPIICPPRENVPNDVGMSVRDTRREVAAAHDDLQRMGVPAVTYVDGLDLMGEADAHLLPDGVHPNGEGYELLAERYLNLVHNPLAE